jgi:hypothetical protein
MDNHSICAGLNPFCDLGCADGGIAHGATFRDPLFGIPVERTTNKVGVAGQMFIAYQTGGAMPVCSLQPFANPLERSGIPPVCSTRVLKEARNHYISADAAYDFEQEYLFRRLASSH